MIKLNFLVEVENGNNDFRLHVLKFLQNFLLF